MKFLAKFLYPEIFTAAERLSTQVENYQNQILMLDSQLLETKTKLSDALDQNESGRLELLEKESEISDHIERYGVLSEQFTTLSQRYSDLETEYHQIAQMSEVQIRAKYDQMMENADNAWSIFEVMGFDQNGVKINFNWNRKFIDEISKMGFSGESEEEQVQQFFALMKMLPSSFFDDPQNDIS